MPHEYLTQDLTWFWEIVDRGGLADVPSDERGALAHLSRCARAFPDLVAMKAEIDRLTFALSDTRMEIATLRETVADLVKALERARPYVDCAVHDDGGIDHCDISYRTDLETIDAALEKARQP